MARKQTKTSKPNDDDEKPTRPAAETAADKKLLERVRDRYKAMYEADRHNRDASLEDLRFVHLPGAQWDDAMKAARGDRPCYEFNELRIKCKRIVNDMRANRSQAHVSGYEDTDKKTAEIYEGLGRNMWNCSDADTTVDNAGQYQVAAGFACWRIVTDYESDLSMDQDIYVDSIKNPSCLFWDEAAKDPIKRDARDWVLTEKIPREVYNDKYKGKDAIDFETEREDDDDWGCDSESETVRIAEYWYKEPVEIELWQLKNGMVIDSTRDPRAKKLEPNNPDQAVVKKRKVKAHNIMMTIVSGNAVLEKPKVCAGPQHRFIVVFGESVVIDGKTYYFGLPRFSKDAQRNSNITNTVSMEVVAKQLQSPYWATAKQVEGLVPQLKDAFQKGSPVAIYNADPAAPGPPIRTGEADMPVAMLQLAEKSARLMDATTGVFPPSVGGSEPGKRSGRAIIATQQAGEIATFDYKDNMSKSVMRTWEIFISLVPFIYDTERTLRVLGNDGTEDFVKVNSFVQMDDGSMQPLNDLRRGKYDVTVTSGPSFSTKRQEATEMYSEVVGQFPQIMGVAGDLITKSWDLPYSEEISERMRTLLPPQIQEQLSKGKQVPPEVAQGMAQVQQASQVVQQQGQLVQQAAQEAEQRKAEAEKAEQKAQTALEKIKTEEARFEAKVAKAQAQLQERAFNIESGAVAASQDKLSGEREQLAAGVEQMLTGIVQHVQQLVGEATVALAQMKPHVVVPPRPRLKEVRMDRLTNKIVPVYEQGTDEQPMVMRDISLERSPDGASLSARPNYQPGVQ